jgi:hypothetical protein
VVTDRGVAAVGQRAGATITNSGHVIRISTENPRRYFGHETAVIMPDNLKYNLIVLHLCTLFLFD